MPADGRHCSDVYRTIACRIRPHNRELKEGDKAPDQYKRDEAAIKDWKAKGLPAPEKESHWVRMGDRYVLVQTTNGVCPGHPARQMTVPGRMSGT
nr:hypothetical protein [Prescottella equi]